MPKKIFALFAVITLSIFLSGCSIQFGNGSAKSNTNDGGIYKSINKGNNWQQKTLVPTVSGKPGNFGSFDSYSLAMDPSDRKAIYLGTIGEGLLFSYDGGETWQRSSALGKATVRSIAVDSEYKCTLYAAIENRVEKSIDCGRAWNQVYFDNDTGIKINTIAIDAKDSNNVFIGTSRGEVIRSTNRGESWQTINRFSSKVLKLLISPHDSKIIFAATENKSLHISNNSGNSWNSLDEKLKDFKDSVNFKDLAFSNQPGKIFLASKYGLLKSADYGKSWTAIDLITPTDKATINSLAVNPKNDDEIYYVTNTTFYRSQDGGKNWTTKKLPSSRAGWNVLVDPVETSVVYLTVRNIK